MPADNDALAEEYQGMPLFAEVGPLVLDPMMSQEAERIVRETIESYDNLRVPGGQASSQRAGSDGDQLSRPKEFKIMTVNGLRSSKSRKESLK